MEREVLRKCADRKTRQERGKRMDYEKWAKRGLERSHRTDQKREERRLEDEHRGEWGIERRLECGQDGATREWA